MNMIARPVPPGQVVYPDSDGKPMAENTLQYLWIVTIKENLDLLCRDNPAGFVAADNFIYPVEGNPRIVQAPDVYVALGRPRGHRGSYKVWEEGGVFPQVIFEVLSPGNRGGEMARKFQFYNRYGAQEYYIYDPDTNELSGWRRVGAELEEVPDMNGWSSPLLGVKFDLSGPELVIYLPDGQRFLTYQEVLDRANRAEQERQRAEQQRQQAEADFRQAEQENDRLRALLRASGIDPDRAGG
jgi:Uma2 family endonuclease